LPAAGLNYLAPMDMRGPPAGPPSPEPAAGKQSKESSVSNEVVPYSLLDLTVRMANEFRDLPSVGQGMTITIPTSNRALGFVEDVEDPPVENQANKENDPVENYTEKEKTAIQMINESAVKAFSWTKAVTAAMEDSSARRRLEEQMGVSSIKKRLREYFGGEGNLTEAEVRERVLQTMKFVNRTLGEGMRYVFPADRIKFDTLCGPDVVARVASTERQEYFETEGPVCTDEKTQHPWYRKCAKDSEGKYVVYVCEALLDLGPTDRIATLIHQTVHFTGPRDITDKDLANLTQRDQLDNAANYRDFARKLAADEKRKNSAARSQSITHGVVICLCSIVLLRGMGSRSMIP